MKIEKEESVVLNTLTGKQTKFTIDEDGADFIIEALSKTIYKNPVGTLIREYVSNAYDANKENGIEDPVIVSIDRDSNGEYLSVVDYGVGLSEDRIETIFCRYGKSTKRGDNTQIGGFGIGAKSGFAYSDTFFINTVHNNVLYNYVLYKTEKVPQIQLLMQSESTERNSTQIKIYIKDNDSNKFHNEVKQQLRYFDFVYAKHDKAFNDAKIVEHNTFLYSNLYDTNGMFNVLHICLGKVAYPINFNLIGINPIKFPFALKFEIGDLPVTLSREELQYDNDTIQKIKDKIEDFKKEIKEIYLEQNVFEYDNLFDRENFEETNPRIKLHGNEFRVESLITKKISSYSKEKDFSFKFPVLVKSLFEIKGTVNSKNGNVVRGYGYGGSSVNPSNKTIFLDLNRTSKDKNIFLFEKLQNYNLVVMKSELNYKWYRKNLNLSRMHLGNFKLILEFKKQLIEDFKKYGEVYSEVEITAEYKKNIRDAQKIIRDAEKEKQLKILEEKKRSGEIIAYSVTASNYKNKRIIPYAININSTHKNNRVNELDKIIFTEYSNIEKIKDFIKENPIILNFYSFVAVTDEYIEILKSHERCIYFDENNIINHVKCNKRILQALRIQYFTKYNSLWKMLTSNDYRNIKDFNKFWFDLKFKRSNECVYLINDYGSKIYQLFQYSNLSSLSQYATKIGIKRNSYMSYEDMIEINLSNRIMKQIPLINYIQSNMYSNSIEVINNELRRRGFRPGKQSYQPVDQWEIEFIDECKRKEKYLNEIKAQSF